MPERVLRLGIDPRGAVQGGQKFNRAADSSVAAALGLNKAVLKTAAGVTAVGAALVGASAALGRFAQAGGRQLTVQAAFARRVGDTESALVQLRAATSGLVTDMELMTQANQSLTLGSSRTVDEFAELAATAQTLGRALGLDVAFALNSLNIGIARQSRLVLDNVGLIVSAEVANRKYAAALGVTTDQLTDAEKQEAFRVEAINQARQKTEELGETTLNAGDAFVGFNTELSNTVDHFSRMVAQSEAVTAFFNDAANAVRGLRGDFQELNAERVMFLETGGTALSPAEAADATLNTSGRRAGGATQFGARGSGVANLSEQFKEAQARMEEMGLAGTESFEDMIAGVKEFEAEMSRLERQLSDMGDIVPRTLSADELLGIRATTGTPLSDGQSGLYAPELVGVTSVTQPQNEFQKWVGKTADNLKPLAEGADESADALDGFSEGLLRGFDTSNFMSTLGANLASGGISMIAGALGDALFGQGYVTILEQNTQALEDLANSLEGTFGTGSDVGDAILRAYFPDAADDVGRRQQFQARQEILQRRFAATDADPEEQFKALQELLMQSVGGGFAPIIATLNTENIDDFLTQVLDSIQAGTFDPELLGSLTTEQFLDLVGDLESLADSTGNAVEEMDKLTKSLTALNSPQGLNLALLGYNAATGGGGIDGEPFIRDVGGGRRGDPGDGGGRDTGGGSRGGDDEEQRRRTTSTVTNNFYIDGSRDPERVADEIVRIYEREASRGGPTTFTTLREARR